MSVPSAKFQGFIAPDRDTSPATTNVSRDERAIQQQTDTPTLDHLVASIGIGASAPNPTLPHTPAPPPAQQRRRASDKPILTCHTALQALFDDSIREGAAALQEPARGRCLAIAQRFCPSTMPAVERGDVVAALAEVSEPEWGHVVDAAVRISPESLSGPQRARVLQALARVPRDDREAFVQLCAPLADAGLTSGDFVSKIDGLTEALPHGARAWQSFRKA